LAKQFVPALEAYSSKIAGLAECQRIKRAVDDTAALLKQCQTPTCHAATIDQLINLIWGSRCDQQIRALNPNVPSNVVDLRYDAVRKAKVATAACFLDRESAAAQHQIVKYRDFIQGKVMQGVGLSLPCHLKLRRSTARVLSFNYDRLFEIAFFGAFADAYVKGLGAYADGALNSGLTAFGDITDIERDRFCFLKLHGSSGILCNDGVLGEGTTFIGDVANWKEVTPTDALFFQATQWPKMATSPMIVFPYEKDVVVSKANNELPFRTYVEKVWGHAGAVLKDASEVWVIGYSFDWTDCSSLVGRIKGAEGCERLVIQNLPSECDRIERLLRNDYGLQMRIDKHPEPF
jgi:hypothetical protein